MKGQFNVCECGYRTKMLWKLHQHLKAHRARTIASKLNKAAKQMNRVADDMKRAAAATAVAIATLAAAVGKR